MLYTIKTIKTMPDGRKVENTSATGTELTVTKFPAGFLNSNSSPRITIELYRTVVHSRDLGDTSTELVFEVTIPEDADEVYVMNERHDTVDSYSLTPKNKKAELRTSSAAATT